MENHLNAYGTKLSYTCTSAFVEILQASEFIKNFMLFFQYSCNAQLKEIYKTAN